MPATEGQASRGPRRSPSVSIGTSHRGGLTRDVGFGAVTALVNRNQPAVAGAVGMAVPSFCIACAARSAARSPGSGDPAQARLTHPVR
jgi:hypothetical protein